jgi:hypothetical protein
MLQTVARSCRGATAVVPAASINVASTEPPLAPNVEMGQNPILHRPASRHGNRFMNKIFQILEGFAFSVVGVCLAVIVELVVAELIVRPGYHLNPGPMIVFPILLGFSAFRLGYAQIIEMFLLAKCGIPYGRNALLGRVWIVGFVAWGVVVWAMVKGYGPFSEWPFKPHWDSRQIFLLAATLSGPPTLVLVFYRLYTADAKTPSVRTWI